MSSTEPSRYARILIGVFEKFFTPGAMTVPFTRTNLKEVASELGVKDPDNWGDALYSYRFRYDLPSAISDRAPAGKEWAIFLAGRSKYEFKAVTRSKFTPRTDLLVTKIPNATPEIVVKTALGDEQALLAKVRYNRLVDLFIGASAYSLQNHLRTTAAGIGQTEIDELYVAVDRFGVQYIVPVQAKGGNDKIGVVQVAQDLAVCREKFGDLVPRLIAAQFITTEIVALFEFSKIGDDDFVIAKEKHYQLVGANEISSADLALYKRAAESGE